MCRPASTDARSTQQTTNTIARCVLEETLSPASTLWFFAETDVDQALLNHIARAAMDDERTRLSVTSRLVWMGAPGQEALCSLLAHEVDHVRYLSLVSLGDLGVLASEHRAHVEPLLEDPDSTVRGAARSVLERLDGRPVTGLPPARTISLPPTQILRPLLENR